MKNFNLALLLLAAFPALVFGQDFSFTLDLSSQNMELHRNVVNEDIASNQTIRQIDRLENWLKEDKENFTLNLQLTDQRYIYNVRKSRVAENVEVKIGATPAQSKSFLVYYGVEQKDSDHFVSFVIDEEGHFYFTQENLQYRYAILKSRGEESKRVTYKEFQSDVIFAADEKCHLDHQHLPRAEEGAGTRDNGFDNTEYIVTLGSASDFEFLVLRGGNALAVLFEMVGDAAGAANFYAACNMRVALNLVAVNVELINDNFYSTPFCANSTIFTDAFLYNQIFASSPNQPAGDVTTLWTGTDLRGGLCIGNIAGMANLIGGVCGFRNTNVAQATGAGGLQAHEIGHNLGVGINHGNIEGPYFYGSGTPWHPNTVSTIHDKLDGKSCVEKVETCHFDIDDIYLCGGQTTFCIDVPACGGNIDVGSNPSLFINSAGQLCGTVTGGTSLFSVQQRTPNVNCYVNTISFKAVQCEGETPFYSVPPYGMHEICMNDVEGVCYEFPCVLEWEVKGIDGLFVSSEGGELCIAGRGFGRPGEGSVTIRPQFECGNYGEWITWTINIVECDDPFGFNSGMKNTPSSLDLANSISLRSDLISVNSKSLDQAVSVEVYNVAGQLVESVRNFGNFQVDLSALQRGIYLVTIRRGETILTKKVFR